MDSRERIIAVLSYLATLTFVASPASAQQFGPAQNLAAGDEYDIPAGSAMCERVLTANVVALDQVLFFNRLGAFLPSGMIYALARDVRPISGSMLSPGNVTVRADKRPRPLVLRMNVGDCLQVTFTNLLAPNRVDGDQPATRHASMMVDGLSLVDSIDSAGTNVGTNDSSLAAPGETRTYTWYASQEGPFVIVSAGALTGGEGNGGQPAHGLFGVVNVEPRGSVWYRSQTTAEELDLATLSVEDGMRHLDYSAVYPPGHAFEGLSVFSILHQGEIIHSDLNAIIASIPPGTYPPVPAAAPGRDRNEAFREFTIAYHDEEALVQAFPVLEQEFWARSLRDNMAINYGTGAAGAHVLSTGPEPSGLRQAVGPAANCNDCKYEEFFLSSWPLGDPATIVEREPAPSGRPFAAGKAIEVLYPDDPSNVHHSYLNDHVKMRVVQAGVKEHHVHHVHGHQWLREQNSPDSTLLDSIPTAPGTGVTLDILYNGAGNRNHSPGDALFHCHLYPHFVQGMWALWRVHDVFEDGTRTLPDAELEEGTPVPAVIPLPGIAMPLPPTEEMPGFPFYIPGVPGHRAPRPPLGTVDDGGLPRHVVRGGTAEDGVRGVVDRIYETVDALQLPEDGTIEEKAAMAFHAERTHASRTPEGAPATFITNGRPPVVGAPFADPCVDDLGNPIAQMRIMKAASFEIDAIINKAGWHLPQSRMYAHWADVEDFTSGARAPEPFFMRAHSGDCIESHFVNLAPHHYNEDDYQIFTPTDIISQHIHLVKFDVTSSDGATNGWNYEDGSTAPGDVIERIEAINALGGIDVGDGTRELLEAEPHPFFEVLGAQTTVRRWWADPIPTTAGERPIPTTFAHDHFGPATHQQTGLYSALLIEPPGSVWRDPETGELMGDRFDGGPTSFRADILTTNVQESHREFALALQDFRHAYRPDGTPVNPPGRVAIGLPYLLAPPPEPRPEGVAADDPGTFTVNYRNEPIALRVRDPQTNTQAPGLAGDLSHAYRSDVARLEPAFNQQPGFYPPLTNDVQPGDPFTPHLRGYEGDRVKVRMLAASHEEVHNLTIQGQRWLKDAHVPASGYRNNVLVSVSEFFDMRLGALPSAVGLGNQVDYLYRPGASVDDQWAGNWGILRQYRNARPDLLTLPSNPQGRLPNNNLAPFLRAPHFVCPQVAPLRTYNVVAVAAANALPGGTLFYNQRHGLHDPTALMYVLEEDLGADGKLRADAPVEPLVLRMAAGECLEIRLTNLLPEVPPDLDGFNTLPMMVENFNANQVRPSSHVGIHPQLLTYDMRRSNGFNVGLNPVTTVPPGKSITYQLYAGSIEVQQRGPVVATPIEFGATHIAPADPFQQNHKGLVGALIVEPLGATWTFPQPGTRAVADVTHPEGVFRDFVLIEQDDLNLRFLDGSPVPHVTGQERDSEDSGHKAYNYRTEPMWARLGYPPDLPLNATRDIDFSDAFSVEGTGPIETPIFEVPVGVPVRFRVLRPGGHARGSSVMVQGHMWRMQPGNPLAQFVGSQEGMGPGNHYDLILLHGAGGAFATPGDYLYLSRTSFLLDAGMWGLLRVTP